MEDFEKKLKEAKELLDKLNDPEITLYEAMQYYKKGIKLLEEATRMIEEAKLEFEEIK
ncbi:MAG: exodeoxyribonuclease VII small subunit [Nautiliaceae bacterium]